jgi:double zinc ribbon protein
VLALFGITNHALDLAVNLLVLVLIVLWLALVYRTYADARRRIEDPMLVACATAASLFPFIGTLVYMTVRPPEYLDDVRERELEMQAAEARLHELDFGLCPHCDHVIERDFLRCPSCRRKLKDPCPQCSKPLDPTWQLCPYCEYDFTAAPSTSAARTAKAAPRRRRRTTSEQAAVEAEPSSS